MAVQELKAYQEACEAMPTGELAEVLRDGYSADAGKLRVLLAVAAHRLSALSGIEAICGAMEARRSRLTEQADRARIGVGLPYDGSA
jgi:hypothetical protein